MNTNEYGPKVTPNELAAQLEICAAGDLPSMSWGGPGIGKSDIHKQHADKLGLPLITWHLNMWDAVDGRGIPYVKDGVTHWAAPAVIPAAPCVLFLDEFNTAAPSVMVTMYHLILKRNLGGVPLPEGTIVCCAGNRASDRGSTYPLPVPLRNRMAHFEVEPDVDDWSAWAIATGIDPVNVAFLRFRPELLYQFSKDSNAFPTPRSWVSLFRTLEKSAAVNGTSHRIACATVGEGAAIELTAWRKIVAGMPSIDGILLNPKSAPVPTDPGTLYAVSGALARRMDQKSIPAIMQYLARVQREFGVCCVKDAITRTPALQQTAEFIKWAVDFHGFMNKN